MRSKAYLTDHVLVLTSLPLRAPVVSICFISLFYYSQSNYRVWDVSHIRPLCVLGFEHLFRMRSAAIWVAFGAHLARCAVDINGNQVTDPLHDDDPSPISDPRTYIPDQHDCPLACSDYSNTHSWTPYISVDRLQRCQEPMLLQLSISNLLDDPETTVLIRSCTLGGQQAEASSNVTTFENPKKDETLLQSSLDTAPACFANGAETTRDLSFSATGSAKSNSTEVIKVLDGLQKFFETKDNCDENVVFAYYGKTVAGIYVGSGYGKATVSSLLNAVKSSGTDLSSTVAQTCGNSTLLSGALGLFVDAGGDLVAAQKAAAGWIKGRCVETVGTSNSRNLQKIKTWEIAGGNGTVSNSTSTINTRRRMKPVTITPYVATQELC
jgi:hypothetical protein